MSESCRYSSGSHSFNWREIQKENGSSSKLNTMTQYDGSAQWVKRPDLTINIISGGNTEVSASGSNPRT